MRPQPSRSSIEYSSPQPASPPLWDTDFIAQIQALYDRGLFVQAFTAGASLGPLQSWRGPEARILAGRLASQLFAHRLSDALMLRLWRTDQSTPAAIYYSARALFSRRGSLAALDRLQESQLLDAESSMRWDATAFAAYLHAQYRDFDRAEQLIKGALDHSDTAWIWTERTIIYELEDRYEEALTAARQAFERSQSVPGAILCLARALSLFERDDEAIDLLRNALSTVESPYIASSLADLEVEHGDYARALETLACFDRLAVLKDKATAAWLAGRRSDIYHLMGDTQSALTHARAANTPFYKEVVRNLELTDSGSRRVMLPVGFVRQHHMTCAPATLSALSRYWGQPADHLDLAETICYDGTPHHSQRRWALAHGWYARDFTVTWESTRALIDAGIPFTLTTPFPGGSHLQAVIGYDAGRGVLLIRDPYDRVFGEFAETLFFHSYAVTGPRGMVIVPIEERARLEAIPLPEAELRDLDYDIQHALSLHDRSKAVVCCEELGRRAPGHQITLVAQRALAEYDGDLQAILPLVDQLITLYPKDVNLRLSKASLLRQLVDRSTFLEYLEAQAHAPAAHALFKLRYAQALLEDGRRREEATRLLRTLLRSWTSAEGLSTLADAYWYAGEYRRATDLYRFAATLDGTNEDYASAYFRASRTVRDEAGVLTFLHGRVRRYGQQSSLPAITLFHCLSDLNRSSEAFIVRDQALAQRPDDGELLLFAARSELDRGAMAASELFLERAQQCSKRADWLRATAQLEESKGHLGEARRLWTEVVASEPFNLRAQRTLVRLTSEVDGRIAAVEYLRGLVARFPHHQGLNELLTEWLDEAPLEEQEAALRALLAISPANAWARRQLASTLAKQRRFDAARAESALAYEIAPDAVTWYTTHGSIELLAGQLADARENFRAAIRRSVDSDYALTKLIEACGTLEERREELLFVVEELKRQVIVGDSLLSFQRLARGTFEPDDLKGMLDDAQRVRPDLWQTWVASVRQRLDMQQYEAARAVCLQAIAIFPLIPRLHVELAETSKLAGDRHAERAALQEALRLSPAWGYATRQLADSLESEGDFCTSRKWLETALRHSPTDGLLHGFLGYTLWQLEEPAQAVTHLQQAVRLDIGYDWAWNRLSHYSGLLQQPQLAIELARSLATGRPGDPRAWMAVARMAEAVDEKLMALDRAIGLAPFMVEAHLLKLDLLIEDERFDEALTVLRTTAWGNHPPVPLRIKEPRLLAKRGDKDAALSALQAILADDPNYFPGWELQADWQLERENYTEYLVAARELHRIDPNSPYALGYLADALLKAEPDTDVRPYLHRAIHLKADYTFGANLLFDLELQAGAYDTAEAVLEKVQAHVNTGETRLRTLRLAIARGVRNEAFEVFREMLTAKDDLELYREAMWALGKAGWRREARHALEQLVLDPEVNPVVGTLWVERRDLVLLTLWWFRRFGKVLKNGETGQLAAQALLQRLADREATLSIRCLLWRYGDDLARNDTTHGLMGYALININAPRAVVKWFGDWRQRDGAPAWALLNLACALRDLGRHQEAHAISCHALTREEDHAFPEHRVWLAYDAARAGAYAHANELLALVDEKSVSGYYQFVIAAIRFHILVGDRTKVCGVQEIWCAWKDVRRTWKGGFLFLGALFRIRGHTYRSLVQLMRVRLSRNRSG
ncbi:MAG: C39 family peptidase [Nitrospira sp.]